MSQSALLGATGFVGRNLQDSHDFTALYDSKTIASSSGRVFDLVVCAAAPGSMIIANRSPERDAAAIDQVIQHLSGLSAKRLILISSIATLRNFGQGQDESSADFETETPYGRNRRRLEAFCQAHFEEHLVLRLPALFGKGLRKNMLFDLINPAPSMLTDERRLELAQSISGKVWAALEPMYQRDSVTGMWVLDRMTLDVSPHLELINNAIEQAGFEALRFTNPLSTFQFFDLSTLWGLANRACQMGLTTLHLAPEPLRASDVVAALRGIQMHESHARVHFEDVRTRHGDLFGRADGYIAGAGEVMSQLRVFMKRES
jgi:hypothetical protein